MIVTDGPFLLVRPEVNQLHQDLYGVDEHRPDLLQEVGGLDVRNLFNTQQRTSLIVEQSRR